MSFEAVNTRMVEQRQQFTVRVWYPPGNAWRDQAAADLTEALAINDACIAAEAVGIIDSYAVFAQWVEIPVGMSINITDDLKLTER